MGVIVHGCIDLARYCLKTVLDDGSVQLTVQADQQLLGQIKQKAGLSLDSAH